MPSDEAEVVEGHHLTDSERAKGAIAGGRSPSTLDRTELAGHDCHAMAARLRSIRQERGFTLSDVARAIQVTTACVSQWETGNRFPKPNFWPQLAQTLGVSVSYLIAGEDEGTQIPDRRPQDVIQHAKEEIATSLGVDLSDVRIEVSRR